MYIGFLTTPYGPMVTRRRGGSNGAGVPFPIRTNVTMQANASAAPATPSSMPVPCQMPTVAGAGTPAPDNILDGRNISTRPMNNVEYVTARATRNMFFPSPEADPRPTSFAPGDSLDPLPARAGSVNDVGQDDDNDD